MRYNEKTGVYRDCKWCGGRGCVYCPGEADAEYNRQFPDGPNPIASFDTTNPEHVKAMNETIGAKAIEHGDVRNILDALANLKPHQKMPDK